MRVLVTGATGFIGEQLCQALAAAHNVVAVGRTPSPPSSLRDVDWVSQDLTQPLAVERLPGRIDAVIHLAQSRHYRDLPAASLDVFRVNTAATAELLEWAGRTGIRRFVLASTGGVFAPQAGPVSEETPSTARGLYPLSKRLAEQLVGAYAEHFETVILRFFFPYGPGQRDRLIPDLASSIAAGRPITLRTEGGLRLNPIFASDTVRAIVAALEGGGTPLIHVAGPEIISLRQLAHRIGEIVGRPATFVVDAAAGPQDLIAATDVMRRCLVSPEIGLAEGLRRALSPAGRGA